MDDARPWVPADPTLETLAAGVGECRGCELWRDATQAVFSAGPPAARLMLVGEQPGDREDLAGVPFVGPAGRVLDDALEAAGVRREDAYLTNAVKHFRHERRGKRRIHQKPELRHLVACHPWLDAELDAVDPAVLVALGATAGRAVLGRPVRIGAERGAVVEGPAGRPTVITAHPSSLLRLRDRTDREAAFGALVADLSLAAATAAG